MADVPGHDEGDADQAIAAPALDHVQRRLLDADRILVIGGWLVLIYTIGGNRATNAEHALIGLALLLLGVFLVTLSPVANRFPEATRFGTAVANVVLFYFPTPWNHQLVERQI